MQRQIKFRVWDGKQFSIEPRLSVNLLNSESYVCYMAGFGKTIQFFTGLLDKNNKEIYEGDILRNDVNTIFQVIWNNDGFFTCQADTNNNWIFCKKGIENSEIIGNIFENSELLENK